MDTEPQFDMTTLLMILLITIVVVALTLPSHL